MSGTKRGEEGERERWRCRRRMSKFSALFRSNWMAFALCQQLLGSPVCNGNVNVNGNGNGNSRRPLLGHAPNDNANLGAILGRLLADIPKVCTASNWRTEDILITCLSVGIITTRGNCGVKLSKTCACLLAIKSKASFCTHLHRRGNSRRAAWIIYPTAGNVRADPAGHGKRDTWRTGYGNYCRARVHCSTASQAVWWPDFRRQRQRYRQVQVPRYQEYQVCQCIRCGSHKTMEIPHGESQVQQQQERHREVM